MERMELMQDVSKTGTPLADAEPAELVERGPLVNLSDLLPLLPRRPGGGGHGAAIHSAAAKFVTFIGSPAEETPIHLLETERERFVDFLKARHHTLETVRSYAYCINLLLRAARDRGWETPPQILPSDWVAVMALTRQKELQSIIRFAARINKLPSTFNEEDLKVWSQEKVSAGRTFTATRTNVSQFRRLMSEPELSHLRPLVQSALKGYGTPVHKMHPSLRGEVENLLAFLSDDFEFERSGPPLRKATLEGRCRFIERFVGFVENIEGRPRVEALSDVFTKNIVTAFIRWSIQQRGVQGESMFTGFSGISASIKKHPRYADLDLSWLPMILGKLPRVQQSEIDRRKEGKYISFETANGIPAKIREARARMKDRSELQYAVSLRNELIMLWLVILPWRQRNLRECRIAGGPHMNLFYAQIPKHSPLSRSEWLAQQEKTEPEKPVWQIYFSSDETKSKNEISGFLPYELTLLLEEYLEYRPALIPSGKPDPGTLFVTTCGTPLDEHGIETLVQSLTSTFAGKAVNPHLFRDIVAYEWLREHPQDYLTLSKLLWHKSVERTLKVYGSRFNESTGIARMDDWRASRKKAA
jgi:integrase